MPFTLRRADAADGDFLLGMLAAASSWRPGQPALTAQKVLATPGLAHYVVGWPRSGDFGVIAEDGAQPVGAAWARLLPASDPGYGFYDAATPELAIGVVESRRAGGIGARLLDSLVAVAHERGLDSISLSVEADNPARRLYERVGFRRVGEVTGSLTMVLHLPRAPG